MNKPKRYGADGDPKWDGCFVEWEEYAKLSVELRRLRASSFVTNVPSEDFEKLETENARLKAEVERLKEGNECLDQMHEKEMARSAFLCEEVNRTTSWGRGLESDLSWARAELLMVKAEVERLTGELKFSEHRMISLAEALADTRLGFQKRIEVLQEGRSNPKRDQGTNKADNKGKPSRSGGKGEIVRDKPKKGRGTY